MDSERGWLVINAVENSEQEEQWEPIRTVKGYRPLCFYGNRLICSKYNRIYSTEDLGRSFNFIGSFKDPSRFSFLLSFSRLLRRIFRSTVYRLRVMDNGNIVFVFKGGIYLLRPGHGIAEKVLPITKGSRPVSLAHKPGGLIVFGEYHENRDREAIHIYGSNDFGETWRAVYTFPAGSIRHIHGITYDKWDDCFWICSGDFGSEVKLFRAGPRFGNVEVALEGGQANRFYSLVATKNKVVMANDSPNAANHICELDKKTGKSKKSRVLTTAVITVAWLAIISSVPQTPSPRKKNRTSHPEMLTTDRRLMYGWQIRKPGKEKEYCRFRSIFGTDSMICLNSGSRCFNTHGCFFRMVTTLRENLSAMVLA